MSELEKVYIYTDGGARGNPGPAGVGAAIYDADGNVIREVSQYVGEQTNNWAEYEAVIAGLEALRKHVGTKQLGNYDITVKLDSELVTKQLNNEYQIKEETLFPQFIRVHNMLVKDFPHVSFVHVRRAENTHADRLANAAMDAGRS